MGIRAALKRGLRYIVKGVPVVKVEVNISQITMPELLKDRHIIITGGGRGLGFYMAKKCVELGAEVLITGRNEQTLLEACQKLGEKCHFQARLLPAIREITCVVIGNEESHEYKYKKIR